MSAPEAAVNGDVASRPPSSAAEQNGEGTDPVATEDVTVESGSSSESEDEDTVSYAQDDQNNQPYEEPVQITDVRNDFLSRILKDTNSTIEGMISQYDKKKVDYYLKSDDDHHEPTILHWAVTKWSHSRETESTVDALKLLIKFALGKRPELLRQAHRGHGTVLHQAVTSREQEIVRYLCEAAEDKVSDAICVPNSRGETCLHLAIHHRLEVANVLIAKADSKTFSQMRNKDDNGIPLPGGGNTPLHDAVNYGRCEVNAPSPSCKTEGGCTACLDAKENYDKKRARLFEEITGFVGKHPEALGIKNAAGESPYLFHLSTRRDLQKRLSGGQLSPANTANATEATGTSEAKHHRRDVDPAATVPPPAWKLSHKGSDDAPSKKNNIEALGKDGAGLDKKKKRSGRPSLKVPLQKSDTGQDQRIDTGVIKPKKICRNFPLDTLSKEVEVYLKESSFKLGSFTKACECLFQSKSGSQEEMTILRPGHSLPAESQKCYRFLNYAETMSQVDLEVASYANITDSKEVFLDEWTEDMENLKRIFSLLRDKNVKQILKLRVLDNSLRYCSDETIEACLHKFDVRYLDWNKEDLCASILLEEAPNVVELWLYTSGSNAVLRSWCGSDGLCKLNQLMKLHLVPKRGLETYERQKRNVAQFKTELQNNVRKTRELLRSNGRPVATSFQVKLYDEALNSKEGFTTRQNLLDSDQDGNPVAHRWKESVEQFTGKLKGAVINKKLTIPTREVKVALIDDGVTPNETLSERLAPIGWPEPSPASESKPFYHSFEGHGTAMAELICDVCPYVRLYVAKLEAWQKRSIPGRSKAADAAEAVRWAIEKKVDIISMSWSLAQQGANSSEDINKLKEQIMEAGKHRIIMYCAAEDMALYNQDGQTFPSGAGVAAIKTVGSAQEGGEPADYVNVVKVDYLFPGEDVVANWTQGSTPATTKLRGSSAATALAAGLAALVLWCFEADRVGMAQVADPGKMHKIFQCLTAGKDSKWVDVTRLLSGATGPDDVVTRCTAKFPDINLKKVEEPPSTPVRRQSIFSSY